MKRFLYDTIADRWYRGGSVYLYSDPHFNDPDSAFFRKNYPGDDAQVKSINSRLGKNDTIVFLGDIGDIEFIKRIRGYKVLIMGNHDSGASNYKKDETNQLFDEVFEGPLMVSERIILSHEPIDIPEFLFNVHGHDHSGSFISNNHLNVCAEHIGYRPVLFADIIKSGLLRDVPSIHRVAINKATANKKNLNNV